MIIFTVIFGNLVRVSSDGAPYAIFSYTALVPWGYFSSALAGAGNSLAASVNIINRVYFPRVILPLVPVIEYLLDFLISFCLLLVLMLLYRVTPTTGIVMIPFMILIMMLATSGLGMLLTALAVQYRDVAHAMGFAITISMYFSPVIYPLSLIPERVRIIYGLNPMVGVIEGFRSAAVLNRTPDLSLLGFSILGTLAVWIFAWPLFRFTSKYFADVL